MSLKVGESNKLQSAEQNVFFYKTAFMITYIHTTDKTLPLYPLVEIAYCSALTLLVVYQEGHPACKIPCTSLAPGRYFFRRPGLTRGVVSGKIGQLNKSKIKT